MAEMKETKSDIAFSAVASLFGGKDLPGVPRPMFDQVGDEVLDRVIEQTTTLADNDFGKGEVRVRSNDARLQHGPVVALCYFAAYEQGKAYTQVLAEAQQMSGEPVMKSGFF
jgi:hypothetical protein